jgi:uncharacterized protein YkwD
MPERATGNWQPATGNGQCRIRNCRLAVASCQLPVARLFRRRGGWSLVLAAFVLGACATAPTAPPGGAPSAATDGLAVAPPPPLPPAAEYTTNPRPDGITGGPRAEALARQVREALRARGDEAEADGALAPVAAWLAGQTSGARQRGAAAVALRAGFPGAVSTAAAFRLDAGNDDVWKQALAEIASNLPVTRYAVYVSPDDIAVIVFGRMEASLAPFPRRFRSGESCRLRGEIAARYAKARVYLTRPDGKVDVREMSGRKVDVALPLSAPGVYQVEVMSDGATGPVVLANAPIYVGVDEPPWSTVVASTSEAPDGGRRLNPTEAEARMLTLLNEARRAAGLRPLASDPELRGVALAHTQDMIAARFFGHVSPTTGMVENRLQRAGVVASIVGENVAQADGADDAHRVLMDSPGHRANMLGGKFTHVGIGASFRPGESGDLLVTLVFARRPAPPSTPVTPAVATTFVSSLRRAKGAAPIAVDPVLQKAADAGAAVLTSASSTTPDQAIAAAHTALVNESKRLHMGRGAVCIEVAQVLELDELEQDPIIQQAKPMKVGLAAATRQIDRTVKIFVVIVAEGAKCG